MRARLEQLWIQLVDFVRAQPPARRIVLATTSVGSLVVVLGLAWWVQRPLYRPLFTNLAERDASAIVEALRAEKVPFRLEDGGRAILAPAERSLFVGEDRRPSASVVVTLAPGRALSAAQIDGIVHLVAASVEGLAADGVTVVDEGGRMLATDRRGGETVGAWSGALEMQASIERQLAERVESMLAAVVGRDKAVARVAATLGAARVERTEETN